MPEISPEVEQQLADMSAEEWAVLTAKVRAPDLAEQYRDIAKTVVPEHILDEFMRTAKIDAFVTDDGKIDAERLLANLNILRSAFRPAPGRPAQGDGAAGRAEAQRRGYIPNGPNRDAALRRTGRSGQAAGEAEAGRRFGNNGGG